VDTIVKLDNPIEALVLAKQVSEEFVVPTFSDQGRAIFPETLDKDLKAAFANSEVDVYGIRSNQALVAYMAVGKKSHISQLFVAARKQRQGLGRLLIQFVEQQAKEIGISQLTVRASLNAVPFYEKCGFEATSDVQEISGIRFRSMQKTLDCTAPYLGTGT